MTRGQITLEQGHIINHTDGKQYIIVSHDCDIAHTDELFVEIVELTEIEKFDGNRTKAKNVRELHIQHNRKLFKLIASTKKSVEKTRLRDIAPMSRLDESNLRILQKWLACRYKRHSIPEELNKVVRPIFEDSAKKVKDTEDAIDGVYMAYEEIDSKSHTYEISIKVVYDSQKTDGEKKATDLAERIGKKIGENPSISSSCDALSDHEFTLAEMKSFMEYRLDFLCD
jgi:hypothetical protein